MPTLVLRRSYAIVALAIFLIEIVIALFVSDDFIRPYVGDVLAVMFVYAGLRAVLSVSVGTAVTGALAIALVIELGQLVDILEIVGLDGNAVARVVFGTSFEWLDLVAYLAGGLAVLVVERLRAAQPV